MNREAINTELKRLIDKAIDIRFYGWVSDLGNALQVVNNLYDELEGMEKKNV